MVSQAISVVRGKEYDTVFEVTGLLQGGHDFPHLFVNHCHVGKVIGSLALSLFVGRSEWQEYRVMVNLVIVKTKFLKGCRLIIEFIGRHREKVEVLFHVRCGVTGDRIVRRVGPGEANL